MHNKLCLFVFGMVAMHHCTADPSGILQRPSAINPNIPMEPKPADRISYITDLKEIAKFKREIKVESITHHHVAPTGAGTSVHSVHQPDKNHPNNRHSRDVNARTSVTPQLTNKEVTASLNEKRKPAENPETGSTSNVASTTTPVKLQYSRLTSRSSTQASVSSTKTATVPATPTKHRPKHDEKPLFNRDYRKERVLPSQHSKTSSKTEQKHATVKPLTLSAQTDLQKSQQTHVKNKRDIPVPLVAKHKHPEESPRADEKEVSLSNPKSTNDNSTKHSYTTNLTIEHEYSTQHKHNDHEQR